jgi:Membrane-fusion protein
MKISLICLGFFLIFFSGCPSSVPVSTEHSETTEQGSKIGPNLAVVAADPERGFRLSPVAIQFLQIKWSPLASGPVFSVPESSIVFYQERTGVYLQDEGWFRLIPVRTLAFSNSKTTIESPQLKPKDLVASEGVGFLRVTELELSGESHSAHAH